MQILAGVGAGSLVPPTAVDYLVVAGAGGGGAHLGGGGGAGGSGIVIIRYADTFALATSTTGSPTVTTTGGYNIYSFTGSGTITF